MASADACDEPSGAVDKLVFILRGGLREAIGVEDRELIQRHFPIVCSAPPFSRDVA